MSVTRDLYVSLMRRAVASHDHRQTRDPFLADNSNLDLAVTQAIRHHGSDTTLDKINVLDPPVSYFQPFAQGKVNGLESGRQQIEIVLRQRRKDLIDEGVFVGRCRLPSCIISPPVKTTAGRVRIRTRSWAISTSDPEAVCSRGRGQSCRRGGIATGAARRCRRFGCPGSRPRAGEWYCR